MVRVPRRRLVLLYSGYCIAVFAVVFGLAELALRIRGDAPWRPQPALLRVDPGGRLYQADPELGYRMLPGQYTVRFESGDAFRTTHGDDSLRVTRPAKQRLAAGARGRWIFGCSFSYGWAVDDDAVYAWQLQQALPDWHVVNFSVNGYGTLQSRLQLERALRERPAPEVILLAYAAFHEERNTFVRQRRKRVAPFSALGPLVQPYARLDEGGRLRIEMADVEYHEWPGMRRSAVVHVAGQRWNRFERARANGQAVTRLLVREFVERGLAAGARVIVAGIAGDTAAVLREARPLGAVPLALAVDLDAPGMRNPPPDAHPSPKAHRRYAARILQALGAIGKR